MFLTGELDMVKNFMPAEAMDGWVTDLRKKVVVPGAGPLGAAAGAGGGQRRAARLPRRRSEQRALSELPARSEGDPSRPREASCHAAGATRRRCPTKEIIHAETQEDRDRRGEPGPARWPAPPPASARARRDSKSSSSKPTKAARAARGAVMSRFAHAGHPGPGGEVHAVEVVLNKAGTDYITVTEDNGTITAVDTSAGKITLKEGTPRSPTRRRRSRSPQERPCCSTARAARSTS